MLIIFDLDYTLLDTLEFKKGLAEALDMEFDLYKENCKKHFKNKNILYNLEKHLNILEQENSDAKISADFLSNIGKYLFPEVEEILKKMKDAGHKLILLTYGDKEWQRQKVENLNIKDYFDEVIYTDKGKGEACVILKERGRAQARQATEGSRELQSSPWDSSPSLDRAQNDALKENILIINDNARECLEMREALGECEVFLVKGRYFENAEHDFTIRELGEIHDFVINSNKS